jgi:TonB family protein
MSLEKMKHFTLLFVLLTFAAAGAAQDAPAKLISGPPFRISAEDEAAGISGKMQIAVSVDKEGNVTQAGVYVAPEWPCAGNLDYRVLSVIRDAEKTVKGYKFSPKTKNGQPVETRLSVNVTVGKAVNETKPPMLVDAPEGPYTPKQINGGVINGKALSLVKPPYPSAAKEARASGTVKVQVLIGEDGKVIRAQALTGEPVLHFAARSAACDSKFSPTLLDGNPVKVSGVIVYNFVP